MKKVKISILLLALILPVYIHSASAAQTNSENYRQNVIASAGGENATSSSYKMGVAAGIINSIISSASYINKLGFFHTWLLADNQPCTSASQCEGGFCCSSLCKSSACPVEAAAPSGPSGSQPSVGGGPLATVIEEPKIKSFSVSPGSIKEHLALGAAKATPITIKNTGNAALKFDLSVGTIDGFVFLSDTGFSLEPGEEKTVEANIIGKKLGSYLGEINIAADGLKKSVDVIVEVASEQALFDVKIDIPSGYKEVEAGGELKAQITLLNVGPPKKVDVTTTYIIKDRQGNVAYESTETFAVEKQKSFVKSFKVPKDLKPGDYLAIIEVRYENSFAVSSELFRVVPKGEGAIKILKSKTLLLSMLVIFIGLMFLFAYLLIPRINAFRKPKSKRGK